MTDEDLPQEPIEVEISDTLDLHSFRPAEVADVLESYLEAAAEAGIERLRIIHGKGVGVQRRTVQRRLERHPLVVSFTTASESAGGWGATTVIMKPSASPEP